MSKFLYSAFLRKKKYWEEVIAFWIGEEEMLSPSSQRRWAYAEEDLMAAGNRRVTGKW